MRIDVKENSTLFRADNKLIEAKYTFQYGKHSTKLLIHKH